MADRHLREGLSLKVALLALYQRGQGVPPSLRAPAIPPAHSKLYASHGHAPANIDLVRGLQLIAPAAAPVQGNGHSGYNNNQADIDLAPVLHWTAPLVAPVAAPEGNSHNEDGYVQANIVPAAALQAPTRIAPPVPLPSGEDDTQDYDVVDEDDDESVFTDINQFLGSDDGFSGLSETERRTKMDEFIDQVSYETKIELSDEDVEDLNDLSDKNKKLFLKLYNRGGLAGSQAR